MIDKLTYDQILQVSKELKAQVDIITVDTAHGHSKGVIEGVKKIKEILKPVPIMAVVTETSIDWEFKYLVDHLMEEREWYRKQNR